MTREQLIAENEALHGLLAHACEVLEAARPALVPTVYGVLTARDIDRCLRKISEGDVDA